MSILRLVGYLYQIETVNHIKIINALTKMIKSAN
jgi:hypothetical protein